jgi:hypothetical protein
MIGLIFLAFICSVFYFVEAKLHAMPAKRWAFIGICLGPMALPLFSVSKNVAMRKASGFNSVNFHA